MKVSVPCTVHLPLDVKYNFMDVGGTSDKVAAWVEGLPDGLTSEALANGAGELKSLIIKAESRIYSACNILVKAREGSPQIYVYLYDYDRREKIWPRNYNSYSYSSAAFFVQRASLNTHINALSECLKAIGNGAYEVYEHPSELEYEEMADPRD